MERQEDSGLIEECKRGSREAFEQLVVKYHNKVFNVAYKLLNNYDEANDIAQEVFVRAWRAIKGFRQESRVFTWLYRIAVNACKNRGKVISREKRRLCSLDDPVTTEDSELAQEVADKQPLPSQALIEKERAELIQVALASLEAEFKEVLVLRDIEGLSYEEISQILKINAGTVKSRLHRARLCLKEKLGGVLR